MLSERRIQGVMLGEPRVRELREPVPATSFAVVRRRCLAELRRLACPISWIAAPAGTGKTHLLRQVAEGSSGKVVFLQVEEADIDPGRFFRRLARTATKAAGSLELPPFGREDLSYLRGFATAFFAALGRCGAPRLLLALDDMHHLSGAPELLDAIAAGISKAPEHLALAVASREAPPPSWAPLLAAGRVAQLGLEHLLMDAEEVRTLLRAHPAWRRGCDDGVVSDLLAASQGWASGIGVLIALSAPRPSGLEPFSRQEACDRVFDNFSQQIFASFSRLERHQLMLVADCPVLDPEILRDLLGGEICALLERLCRNNTLVAKEYAAAGEVGPRYRLHALLRDFLRHEGKQRLASRDRRDFSARLARRLLARGEAEAARQLFVEAKDWRRLAAHLEEVSEELFATGRIHSLTRYLNALPEMRRRRSTSLCYWRGLCMLSLDPAEARRELTAAYDRLKAGGAEAARIQAWGAAVDALWFEWEDCARLDPLIEELTELRALAARLNQRSLTKVLVKGAFAALSLRSPEHPDFKSWEEQNLALFQRRLPRSETIQRGLQLMIHYVYGSGERRKAEIVLARLRQIYDPEHQSVAEHCCYHVVNAAYQFWFAPDSKQSAATVMTGLAANERLNAPFWDVPLLNAGLFRVAADEQVESLRNMLAILDERLSSDSREHDIAISHHFAAYLAWLEGDSEKALIAVEAACRIAEESGFCLSPIYYAVGRAAVLTTLGRRGEALRQLRLARRSAIGQRSATMTFMAHMLGAAIALDAGRTRFAVAYLRLAFVSGEAEGFRTVPWIRAKARNALCDLAGREGIAPDFARALKISAPASTSEAQLPLICTLGRADILRNNRSELTSRKPQVMPLLLMLHLVAAGKSGRSSDQLIDLLWPETDTQCGRQRLKTTLYRLRKLIGDPEAICSGGGQIRLDESRVAVDAWKIEASTGGASDPVETAQAVVEAYQGDFVDLYTGQVDLAIYREQTFQKVEAAVSRAAETLMAQEDFARAAVLLEKGLERLGHHHAFLASLRECFERSGRGEALSRLDECWSEADLDC